MLFPFLFFSFTAKDLVPQTMSALIWARLFFEFYAKPESALVWNAGVIRGM